MSDRFEGSPWKNPATWRRVVVVLLLLAALAFIVAPLLALLSLAQVLFVIGAGEANRNLRELGLSLARYAHEILLFATWNGEQRPFPFAEFPGEAKESGEEDKSDQSDQGEKPSAAGADDGAEAASNAGAEAEEVGEGEAAAQRPQPEQRD